MYLSQIIAWSFTKTTNTIPVHRTAVIRFDTLNFIFEFAVVSSHIAKQASCIWDTSVNRESLFILPTLDLYMPTHLVSMQVSLAWIEKYLALHIALQAEEGLLPATSDDSWGSFSSSASSLAHTCCTHRETAFGTVNVILHESSQNAVSLSESSLSYESTGISTSFFFRLIRSSEYVVQADCTQENLSFNLA